MRKILLAFAVLASSEAVSWAAKVGQPAPEFTLTDASGKQRSLKDYRGKLVVLEWLNHGCPYVQKHYDSGNMQALQAEAKKKGVVWLSVASSAKGKQGYMEGPETLETMKAKKASPAAILLDPKGQVGRMYKAKTTPHMFLVDKKGTLIYAGAIDDRPTTSTGDVKTAKNWVRQAMDEALAGKPVSSPATAPYGCSVKYE